MLGALVMLAWMLIQFGGGIVSPFAPATQQVRFVANRADGISSGSAVLYRGVNVGRVERVLRSEDQLRVYIDAAVDTQPPLPANLKAVIRFPALLGTGAVIVLETTEAQPQGMLQPQQIIPANFVGLDVLPPEFAQLAAELRLASEQFRESKVVVHLDEQIVKIGKLVDSLQTILNDQQLGEDLRQTLANIRNTTEKTDRLAADLQSLARQTSGRLEQAATLLDQLLSIARKINQGQGALGAMVNDQRLYESLVATARELNMAVQDLRRLLEQWEQEGISIKTR